MKVLSLRFLAPALALASGLLATAASAGVTGVKETNDYTVNGLGSTFKSGQELGPFTTPLDMTFKVSTEKSKLVVFVFTLDKSQEDYAWLFPVGCTLPWTSFFATTNQSVDLDTTSPIIATWLDTSDGDGFATFAPHVPKINTKTTIGTQAAIIDLSCGAPVTMTQAFDVTFN